MLIEQIRIGRSRQRSTSRLRAFSPSAIWRAALSAKQPAKPGFGPCSDGEARGFCAPPRTFRAYPRISDCRDISRKGEIRDRWNLPVDPNPPAIPAIGRIVRFAWETRSSTFRIRARTIRSSPSSSLAIRQRSSKSLGSTASPSWTRS